jgi:thymidylate synthase
VEEQLKREPKELPKLWLNPEVKSIFDYTMDDIKLIDYNPMPSIKAKMAV